MSDEIIFVRSQGEIYRNDEAKAILETTNDSGYADEMGEILSVDEGRWLAAQQYERSTWMEYNKDAEADRNSTHAEGFGGYAVLPHQLGDVIELGCGVFTNLQYILQGREATSVTLLDPLTGHYQSHKHCTYKNGVLQTRGVEQFTVNILGTTIEDWVPQQQYDCVVMVNVLHHCKDAQAVFHNIRTALKPGGWLVFHEPPREIDPLTHYDAGHPLAPHAETLEAFLGEYDEVYREGWYFIGQKGSSGAATLIASEEDESGVMTGSRASIAEVATPTDTPVDSEPDTKADPPPPPEPIKPKTARKPRAKRSTSKKPSKDT